jgi:hypothetical protein
LKTKEKLAKQDAVQEVPKSQKGRRTRASGDRTWRWAWVPQEGGVERPREPSRASRVARASQCGGGREGGWERQRFPGRRTRKAIGLRV